MLTLDGSLGEGGGQILRTALGLSLVTGLEFRIEKIRANRQKPGLQRQHLAAVQAAAAIGQAEVEGAEINSQQLAFHPRGVAPGDYAFAVGTAGSATLVFQTILPALMIAAKPSALVLEGGTHNPLAPPYEFLAKAFLPLVNRMGPNVRAKLDRHGFYPAGGGKMRMTIEPVTRLARLDLLDRGKLLGLRATAIIASLPYHVAERELKVLKRELSNHLRHSSPATRPPTLDPQALEVKSHGTGNALVVEVECASLTEVFVSFGELGVKAEVVAGRLAKDVRRFLEAGVAVGKHLADQILLPMALAGGGAFVTFPLSPHALTNIEVLKQFLPIEVRIEAANDLGVRVELTPNP